MDEINFQKADFDDIDKFTKNLLGVEKINHPGDYEAHIAYYTTGARVLIARRAARSAEELGEQIDQARIAVAGRLEQLTEALGKAAGAADRAANSAHEQARRMVRATWGLVIVTFLLAAATGMLVVYTHALALTPPQTLVLPVLAAPK